MGWKIRTGKTIFIIKMFVHSKNGNNIKMSTHSTSSSIIIFLYVVCIKYNVAYIGYET